MKVLAIDPGYGRVGIAVLERKNGMATLLYSACFETSTKASFSERLCALGEEVARMVKKYAPDALAIETLLFNTNQKTAMLVAEARGVITYEASRNSAPVFEYTPLQVKIALTGYGRGTKQQVTTMVKRLITVKNEIVHDDEYDAIAIGLTHLASVPEYIAKNKEI